MSQVTRETNRFVDKYDVTLDVCISSVLMQSKILTPQASRELDVCVEDETMSYLNRKDVQEAMHARLNGVQKWTVCSSGDQDSVIPLTGSRTLVRRLAGRLRFNTTAPYRAWFHGRRCSAAARCPSRPCGARRARRHSRSRNGRWGSSGRSSPAGRCRLPESVE